MKYKIADYSVKLELPRTDFLIVKLHWPCPGNAISLVSQHSFFHELKVLMRKLVEFVFHLPDWRLVEKTDRLLGWWKLIKRLPKV